MRRKINILIIGTGMYVCGRGTAEFGTILPAVLQAYQSKLVDKLLIAGRCLDSIKTFDAKLSLLEELMGVKVSFNRFPKNRNEISPYERAIRELPDPGAVIIATPDHLHAEMALTAIENKKHVLVVKPLSPSVEDVLFLVKALEENNVYGAVEFHKRWDLANLKLKWEITKGNIGIPLYFHIEYSQRRIIPTSVFESWIEYTNIFQYLGVHYADIIYFITKAVPKRAMAIGQKRFLVNRGIDNYDSMQVIVEWSKGFVSTFLLNWIDPNNNSAMSQQSIKVIGTKGGIESNQTNRGITLVTDERGFQYINPYFCDYYEDSDSDFIRYKGYGIDSIIQFIKDVIAIEDGEITPQHLEGKRPTFRDALISTSLIDAVNRSLKYGNKWIEINSI